MIGPYLEVGLFKFDMGLLILGASWRTVVKGRSRESQQQEVLVRKNGG